jgi:SAM-dependent methyltransferase
MSSSSDWWKGFFTGLMVDFWKVAIPAERTVAETAFFERVLRLAPGSRVLDVPCGHGRHCLELSRRGHRVTGLDYSEEFLAAARASAAVQGIAIDWRQGDMRALPALPPFDAALCAGSSFGFFDDAGNQAFLEGVAGLLRRGARFLIDTGWVAESVLPNFHDRLDMEVAGIRFHAENRYDPLSGSVESRFTATRGDRSESRPARQRVYTCRELVGMVAAAGFGGGVEAFGSEGGEPFRLGSQRLILVATR